MELTNGLMKKVEILARKIIPKDEDTREDVEQTMYMAILELDDNHTDSYALDRAKLRAFDYLERERRYQIGDDDDFDIDSVLQEQVGGLYSNPDDMSDDIYDDYSEESEP